AQPVNPPPDKVTLAYHYKKKPAGAGDPDLPYSDALADPKRTIALNGLDLLAFQSGWSSIFVERHRILFPLSQVYDVKTTDYFLFQTPSVKFANPMGPRLVYPSFELGTLRGLAPGKLRALLDEFFAGLFAAGSGNTTADVSLSAAYSYLLAKGLPRV